jgi:hypothetical protein
MLTGGGAFLPGDGFPVGEKTVNATCAAGRPIHVNVCDDKGNPNGSLACGLEAKKNGSLAIIGSIGSSDGGVTASGLPGLFLQGVSAFELTNPKAYSSTSGVLASMLSLSTAKAMGAKNFVLVLPNVPQVQLLSAANASYAKQLGIGYSLITYPLDTTDFAPVAAEIAAKNVDASGAAPAAIGPWLSALASQGVTPKSEIDMTLDGVTVSPSALKQNAAALEGTTVVSPTYPPTDTANPGIAEFDAAWAKYGSGDASQLSFLQVNEWSDVMSLAAAIKAGGNAATLTSDSVVQDVVQHPIARPEQAPYDFSKSAFAGVPGLSSQRFFSRDVAVFEVHNGVLVPLTSGFVDPFAPPKITKLAS